MAIALMAPMAITSLVPMSWGFPTLVQNNSLTDLQSVFSSANDFETSDISFPVSSTGLLGTTFPTITQLSQKDNMLTQMEQMSQRQYTQFAYPWLSIGFSPVPSMGLL
jgi:formylmethanofuran dehydrogenase subunit E-like metal-binding protein